MLNSVINFIKKNRFEYQLEQLFGSDFRENCRRKR